MSGSAAPYHLRPQKAIERRLFWELLAKIDGRKHLQDYTYLGFGGPMLEDFREAHSLLAIRNMISIEQEQNVLLRQKLNLPYAPVRLLYVDEFEDYKDLFRRYSVKSPDEIRNMIFWLDSTNNANETLTDFANVLRESEEGDILKVTLNLKWLIDRKIIKDDGTSYQYRLLQSRHAALKEELAADFIPVDISEEDLTTKNIPSIMFTAVKRAAQNGLVTSENLYFQPLTSFHYADTERMLTVTGVVLKQDDEKQYLEEAGIVDENGAICWRHATISWSQEPKNIDVPDLSPAEKHFLDSNLPLEGDEDKKVQLISSHGSCWHKDSELSKKKLENYMEYYRYYPNYAKLWS